MNAAQMADEPLVFTNGKITFHPAFVKAPVFQEMIPLFEGSNQKAQDFGTYIYLMYHGRSPYRTLDEAERERMLYHEKRFANPDWLKELMKDERAIAFVDYYCIVALTQGQRLYLGMSENIKRFIEEISNVKAGDGTDLVKLIERGKKLYELQKDIDKMVQEQGQRKVKSDYIVGRFERRPVSSPLAK